MKKNDRKDDASLEAEIRRGQKFSLFGAIAREGGSLMQDGSPVPGIVSARASISTFIREHLQDSCGALLETLEEQVRSNEQCVGQHFEKPLRALEKILVSILADASSLHEFVRKVDFRYGQIFSERPHFQKAGQVAHPDDEYTHASVKRDLECLLKFLTCLE